MVRPESASYLRASRHSIMRPNQVSAGPRVVSYRGPTLPLVLVLVRGLSERKIKQIACGPQHTIALDADG